MGSIVMMYVLPMLLGQTYHLGKEKPGLVIFPSNVANETIKIERYFTDSQYRMVDNAVQMRDFLDVSGKLSLKIKGGFLDVSGEGKYLKDSSSKANGLEILVKVHFETTTFTIPSSIKPNPDFLTYPRSHIGTHYCRSIIYGGDLVASIRISGSGKSDLEHIKGAINAGLKTKGGSFEGDIRGKLELLKKSAVESSSMEINYYATVPLHGVSYTMDGLLKLVEDFPDHVKKINGGLGYPLRMELYPLSSLSDSFQVYVENRALLDELDDLDGFFDDLRITRKSLAKWMSQLPPTLSIALQKKITNFSDRLNDVYATFITAISELDTSQGTSDALVKKAFNAYRDLKPKTGGAHYIRWGKERCDSLDSETVMTGIALASDASHVGRSSDYICSPSNPNLMNPENIFEDYIHDIKHHKSIIGPLKYGGFLDRHKSMKGKNIACSHCRISSRKVVTTEMASRVCPESWTKEYEGHVMGPGPENTAPGQFVCVDDSMSEPTAKIAISDSLRPSRITESITRCSSPSCEISKASDTLPCVVCSI